MKKLLPLIIAIVTTLSASAFDARIHVDNASRITLSVGDEVKTGIVDGLNTFDVSAGTTITIEAVDGYIIESVKETNGSWSDDMPVLNHKTCYLNFYSDYGDVYYVYTAASGDVRTAKATVNVDDASKVSLTLSGTETVVPLVDGENTVSFDPATDKDFIIKPTGEKPLYSISVDGKDITATSDYSYTVAAVDGTRIDILTKYPDIDYAVKFNLYGDDAEDFISGVDVDGKPVFNYMSPDFTVKAGSEVCVYGRTNEYEVTSFTVNGRQAAFYNPFMFIATCDATLDITVQKFASFKMKVVVDDPSRIHVYRGYSYNNEEYELTAGENTVEVLRTIPIISFVPADGCFIESLDLTGEAYTREELQVAPVMLGSLTQDDVITVTTGVIVRDRRAAAFIKNLGEAEEYFSMLRADRSPLEGLAEGYNLFDFYDGDNAFIVRTGAPVNSYVYVNDQLCAESYPQSREYNVSLEDGDAVKVFFGDLPELFIVDVTADKGLETPALTVDFLRVPKMEGSLFKALDGTRVEFEIPENTIARLDGEALQADTDGKCMFTVSKDCTLSFGAKSGIDSAVADGTDDDARWFNLQGIEIDTPSAPGLYIRGGKKVLVK